MGPRTLPLGIPALTGRRRRMGSIESHTLATRVDGVSNPRVELALDSIGRQFGEQDRMPDGTRKARDMSRETALFS